MEEELFKGHRARLRKKFLDSGIASLHDYEKVELLLTFAIPRRDVKPLAKQLIARFKGIQGLMDATKDELCAVEGISENSAAMIRLIKELCCDYLAAGMNDVDVLDSPTAVINFVRMKLAGLKNEAFVTIYLNAKNHVLGHELIHEGTVDQAVLYPRNIISKALNANACGMIIVHNHPSGICDPSSNDIRLTKVIKDAASVVNIRLHDHLIVGREGYFSFSEGRLL